MEFTLLWAALTGVAALRLGTHILRDSLPESSFDSLLASAVVGLFAGRIAAVISQGLNPFTNLADLLIVRGGVSTLAAALAGITTLFFLTGRRLSVLDASTPAILLGLSGWHLGCLWRGACLGTASNLPWSWAEPGSAITRHPVEIYAAIGLVVAAWILRHSPVYPGFRVGLALVLAALVRLATEPLRLSIGGQPLVLYSAGVILGSLGMAAAFLARPRST